jgi:phospholipid/cholesterol/gamma-HCH transport system substrate-binding protein
VNGRGRDLSDALGHLAPFARDTSTLLEVLRAQDANVRRLVRNTGTVFGALSERDGQLRSLVENSNRVFAATASRDDELRQSVVALPTFEVEATKTVKRLAAFSHNANPLITQLRPAARELSPTLQQLEALAPDLKALFKDLDPLIRASRKGLPATNRFLDELRPLLAELDGPLKEINPILSYIGMFPSELGAFFANTVATTQASNVPPGGNPNSPVHYLRTTNPINPENLAAYPFRIGTNRTNAYPLPGNFRDLPKGLLSFETRHCEHGVPTIADSVLALLPQALADGIRQFAYGVTGNGAVAAPRCVKQGKYNVGGAQTDYPHVVAGSGGTRHR